MTAAAIAAAAPRTRLVSPTLLKVFLANLAGLVGFYLLLSVVPQYAAAAGTGGGAGLSTAALMASTVAAELAMPRLVARLGHRGLLVAGLALLGLPVFALLLPPTMAVVTAVGLLRGVGLAVLFVVCGELTAALIPADRRGEGLGMFGVVSGLPAIAAMPFGLWLAAHAGYPVVFVAGGLAALTGVGAVAGLPSRVCTADEPADEPAEPADEPAAGLGVVAAARTPALWRPAIVFASTAIAAGALVTFLPAAVDGGQAAVALLVQSVAATLGRWWAGRYGDQHGAAGLLVPGAVLAAGGMATLALVGSPAAVLVGAVLFGTGFGVVQNASLTVMYREVDRRGYGAVTALWSVAYDAGLGAGAAGVGVVAAAGGYATGFACAAALVAVSLVALRHHRSR
jgi:predicted MFS family arabinose efflux permease